MTDQYKTISNKVGEGYYSEKRSKFLAFSHHVTNHDEIKQILSNYRKKYYDARHVCFAYILGVDKLDFRTFDDGEPSSTAGKPILCQIKAKELTDVLVIVVRYYGGINLGTKCLFNAYLVAAEQALISSDIIVKTVEEFVDFEYPYELTNYVMKAGKDMHARIVEQKYEGNCKTTFAIRKSDAEQFKSKIKQILLICNH